jgi:hypothetical protein
MGMGGWQAYIFGTDTIALDSETVSESVSQRHVLFNTYQNFCGVSEDGVPFCYAE